MVRHARRRCGNRGWGGRRRHGPGQRHGSGRRGHGAVRRARGAAAGAGTDGSRRRQPGRRGQSRCRAALPARAPVPAPGNWGGPPAAGMCSVPSVVAPSGVRTMTSGPGASGTGGAPLPGSNLRRHLNRIRRRSLGRHRLFVGQLGVQRRRRNTLGRLGGTDDHPVPRRVLNQMCGVPRRDHAQAASGLGQCRCGLGLLDIALERFLLLLQ